MEEDAAQIQLEMPEVVFALASSSGFDFAVEEQSFRLALWVSLESWIAAAFIGKSKGNLTPLAFLAKSSSMSTRQKCKSWRSH